VSLWADFLNNRERITDKWPHYFPIYDRHFSRFVNTSCVVLEIGVQRGGSLQLWKKHFGPLARIIGIDIDPASKFEEEQIQVFIGDQKDTDFLQKVLDAVGMVDVVIDDGSHMQSDINRTFEFLYPRISPNGLYLVEDLHTSYWDTHEGGLKRPGTFIEECKTMIDHLNGYYTNPSSFTQSTQSIHFYDSVAVFEKGHHSPGKGKCTGSWLGWRR
jgi:cephalosporin hydroxylase